MVRRRHLERGNGRARPHGKLLRLPWIDREVRVSEERRLQSIRMDPVRTRKPDFKGVLAKDRSSTD